MKKLFTLLFFCCIFLNCSENSNDATFTNPKASRFANIPEAKAEYDNSYMGIYKGIVIGKISGALYINILNNGLMQAKFQAEDNNTYILDDVTFTEEGGEGSPILKKYRFENKNISFEVTLNMTGTYMSTSSFNYFSDRSSKISLIKEKSNSLVKCYTGIFSNDDEYGSLNFVTNGELIVQGLSKKLYESETTLIKGTIEVVEVFIPDNGLISLYNEVDTSIQYKLKGNLHLGEISGYLKKYTYEGDWMLNNRKTGVWQATRLL